MPGSVYDDLEDVEAGPQRRYLPLQGLYPAEFVAISTRKFSWGEKLVVEWKVFISLEYKEHVRLFRYYNLKRDRSKRYCIGDGHDYRKDWIAANGGKRLLDRRKLPISVFKNKIILVAVVTVIKDTQRSLSPSNYWSKIGWIVRPLEAGETFHRLPIEPLDSSGQLP